MKKSLIFQRVFTIITALSVVAGVSSIIPLTIDKLPKARAATYYFATGYYMGDGGTANAQTGLGFQPEFWLSKAADTNGQSGALWRTSSMSANDSCVMAAAVCNTTQYVTLDADGYTLKSAAAAAVNTTDIKYYWMAAAGSDCTASGYFCVGSYTATGNALNVTSVGFQPTFVLIKKYKQGSSAAQRLAMFATDTMTASNSCQILAANCVATEVTGFLSNGFSLGTYAGGATNTNDAGGSDDTYYYVAFRDQTGKFDTGTYTAPGSAVDDTSITGFGSGNTPNAVWDKCSNCGTPQNTTWSVSETYGDKGQMLTDTTSAVNQIQKLQDGGFEIGTAATVQTASAVYYWVAWGGASAYPAATGTFQLKTGTYTGNSSGAATQTVTGVGFKPDLLIVKSDSTQTSVFKTKMMSDTGTTAATKSQYLASATAGVQDCLRSFSTASSGSFVVGQSTVCNNNGTTYYYMAFGNAYDPEDRSGAADFSLGTYEGNGIDNDLSITNIGFQPSMVAIKYDGTQIGFWTTTSMGADSSTSFANGANAANMVQSFDSTGFSIGSGANVNTASSTVMYYWFAFKTNSGSNINFDEGKYTGDGTDNRNLPATTPMVTQPDLVWIKDSGAQYSVFRPSAISNLTDSTLHFAGLAAATNHIDQLNAIPPGFRVDSNAETNTNTDTYYYVMWRTPVYTPVQTDWRWFDAENATDAALGTANGSDTTTGDSLYSEDVGTGSTRVVYPGNVFKLRVKIGETEGIAGSAVKYRVQYDTSSTFATAAYVGENGSTTDAWLYNSANGDGYTDDSSITTTKLSGSPTAGRHNKDALTGIGQGSTLNPAASTTYEHEFTIGPNLATNVAPTANTTYYFRILFMVNSAGIAGSWTAVPLAGGGTVISLDTAGAYDLEISTAPTDVNLGTSGGGNDVSYTFSSGEKIGFWDKRGDSAANYNVTTDRLTLLKVPDSIPGTDITWTSDATDAYLLGAYASDKSAISAHAAYTMEGPLPTNAYSSSVGDNGGFFFQPKLDITNLSSKATGVYSGRLTITII